MKKTEKFLPQWKTFFFQCWSWELSVMCDQFVGGEYQQDGAENLNEYLNAKGGLVVPFLLSRKWFLKDISFFVILKVPNMWG